LINNIFQFATAKALWEGLATTYGSGIPKSKHTETWTGYPRGFLEQITSYMDVDLQKATEPYEMLR